MILEIFELSKEKMDRYLNDEEVVNIILSGRFGIGKTTFLNNYFASNESENIEEGSKYDVVNITPVDYSVLSNQDIFRYIKYDILFEIFKKVEIDEKNALIPIIQSLPVYLQYNFIRLLGTLLLLVPKFGKQYFKLFEELSKHSEEFKEIKRQAEKGTIDKVNEFVKAFHSNEGELYEDNEITEIICILLEKMSDKKKVLVIDDLDRIDPNHIFRILNVLSTHYRSKNKFGFNKVIVVCDIKNIRKIFDNRFGQGVDFSGYIDKFYDKEIFVFDNKARLINALDNIVSSISFVGDKNDFTEFYNTKCKFLKEYLKIFFTDLVNHGLINLRSLFKYYNESVDIKTKKMEFGHFEVYYNWQLSIVLLLELLSKYVGESEELIKKLDTLSNYDSSFGREYSGAINISLLILGYEDHGLADMYSRDKQDFVYHDKPTQTDIHYKMFGSRNGRDRTISARVISFKDHGTDNEKEKHLPSVYRLWKLSYEKLIEKFEL
ncbi:MAG: P-loop NTPase fold protein [Lewinella sp.]|uniref:P-loop NTPase fold protein n=1 Tax=Lewinella sp. TaxID=2004506 RepID=UPI003D6BFCF2